MQEITYLSLSSTKRSIDLQKNLNAKDSTETSVSDQVQDNNEMNRSDTSVEMSKKQFNQSILEANLTVSLSVGNESMSLLFKAAIEEINTVLKSELGENSIQETYDLGVDITPEATADRIVSMSTAFFSQYKDQNPEISEAKAANNFFELISRGIETGFSQAREILDGLRVLDGDIADDIDTTYELVQQGLKVFVESYKEQEKLEEKK